MSSELKPCPACGGEGLYYCGTSGAFYIPCTECTFAGQPGVAPNEAARLWNALPRELEWSGEPPKVPGRYWCRHRERGAAQWGEPYVPAVNIFDKYNLEVDNDVQWAGPIPEPKGGAE